MSSLESCIKKMGKLLTPEDSQAIREIRDDIFAAGILNRDESNKQAVDEYIGILDNEREFIMRQVEAMGGVLADKSLSSSEFTKESARVLDKLARKFPQKGTTRPPTEVTTKGETDLLTERSYRSVEYMFDNFYQEDPVKILDIVANFDMEAALGLAKYFGILPQNARTLNPANYNQGVINNILREIEGTDNMFVPTGITKNLPDAPDPHWFHGFAGEIVLDWVKKNETIPIRFQVRPIDAEMVDANADHPLSQTIKLGAVNQRAQDAEPKVGTVGRGVEAMVEGMTKTAGLAAVPQTKLKDFIRYGMETVGQYTKLNKIMDGFMNSRVELHAALAKEWLDYTHGKMFKGKPAHKKGAKILGELMHASTITGVDVSGFEFPSEAAYKKMNKGKRAMWDKRRADYETLKPFWDRLGGEMGGDRVTYQKMVYSAPGAPGASGAMVPSGSPMEISQAQSIYLRVKDTYANQRTELIENLEHRVMETEADEASKVALIAKLRQEFESGKITPYFPLGRFGKHWAVAKDVETGEVVGFIKRESRRDRNAWMEKMRAMGFNAYPSTEQATDLDAMQRIDPNFVASVTSLVSEQTMLNANGDPIPGTGIADQIWQMYLRSLPEMSARKAFIHREGRMGFTHDALRTFSDQTFHQTHQMGKLRFGYRLNQLVQDAFNDADIIERRASQIKNMEETGWRPPGFDKESSVHEVMMVTVPHYASLYAKLKKAAGSDDVVHPPSVKAARDKIVQESEHDGPWAVPLANELLRRHGYNMNPKSAAWSTNMTKWGFLWFLSTSPAAGALNLTQTAISAYPILRAEFNGQGAGMELWKASGEYLPAGTIERYKAKLEGDELAAIEYFESIGMFSKTRTRELMSIGTQGIRHSDKQEQMMEMAGYIFHKSEEINRVVTGMAAYRLAKKKLSTNKGMTDQERHDKAVNMAEELVEMSHYDYTNTNRPRFMQGDTARVAFLFRNYSLNMQYRLLRDFKDGVWKNKNISDEERVKARQRFLGIMGMTSIFAGTSGLWMFWALEALVNTAFGDDDEPYDMRTKGRSLLFDATSEHLGEIWGEKIADAVMRGPWTAFTEMDLSQRASLNNLWIRDVPHNKRGQDLLLHLAGEGLGPIFGIGMNYFQGFEDVNLGHTQRGFEKMMPKFVSDALKTIRYANQGAQNYAQDIIMSPEEFSHYEKFIQAIGFSPAELTRRYEQNRAIKNMESSLKRRHKYLLDTLFRAYKLQDRALARSTMKDINQWNTVNPRYAIMPQTILQSAKTRANYDMRTVGGIAVDKRLQYLQNELRFTRRPGQ